MVRDVVENHVVPLVAFGEILFGVIDHATMAPSDLNKLDISRAAHARHIRPNDFDLHRECADTTRRAVDQDLLARLNFSFVANGLQRGDARNVDRRCLLKT